MNEQQWKDEQERQQRVKNAWAALMGKFLFTLGSTPQWGEKPMDTQKRLNEKLQRAMHAAREFGAREERREV